VNSGSCTWLELAREVADQLGIEPRLTPVRLNDIPMVAQRPRFCVLSNQKLFSAGIEMPSWQDALSRYVSDTVPGLQ
jgi:dTDP-4-dehydrorhamnose reductase